MQISVNTVYSSKNKVREKLRRFVEAHSQNRQSGQDRQDRDPRESTPRNTPRNAEDGPAHLRKNRQED